MAKRNKSIDWQKVFAKRTLSLEWTGRVERNELGRFTVYKGTDQEGEQVLVFVSKIEKIKSPDLTGPGLGTEK